jgi:hypothetical protein
LPNNKAQESVDWFIGKARTAAGYRKKILTNDQRAADNTIIGKMYLFKYDPKLKKTLPIYDVYPLVFPIEPYSDGFLGLNIHYLSGGERSGLLGVLGDYTNNKKYDKTTKLRMSYDILSGTKKLASSSRPCIKRYLFPHVRSRFIEITADEWDKVAQLPLELFVRKG